jgi:hypothetical protein
MPVFRSRGSIRVYPCWSEDAAKFVPQAIAADLPQLEALAGVVSVTHSIIVFRDEEEPRLTQGERDRLWQAFRVPVFEQMIGEDGTLLAGECEAHNGLHIESSRFSAGDREIDATPCGCGRTEPRLVSPAAQVLRSVATYAR